MPRGGKNKLSAATKKFRGTFRADHGRSHKRAPKQRVQTSGQVAPPTMPEAIGQPPTSFTKAQRAAWFELAPQVAHSYAPSDRATFMVLCKLYAMHTNPPRKQAGYVYAQLAARVVALLEAFGCTPRSRKNVDGFVPLPTATVESSSKPVEKDETPLFGAGLRVVEGGVRPVLSMPEVKSG